MTITSGRRSWDIPFLLTGQNARINQFFYFWSKCSRLKENIGTPIEQSQRLIRLIYELFFFYQQQTENSCVWELTHAAELKRARKNTRWLETALHSMVVVFSPAQDRSDHLQRGRRTHIAHCADYLRLEKIKEMGRTLKWIFFKLGKAIFQRFRLI